MREYNIEKEIPTYEEIIRDYKEILEIIWTETNVEKLKKVAKENNLHLEVDGENIEDYAMEEAGEWVRVEHYKSLSYIYFFVDRGEKFDVEIGEDEITMLADVNPEKFTREMYEYEKQATMEMIKDFE